MSVFPEGELEFDFGAAQAEKLDLPGVPLPVGMSLADFVVEEDRRVLIIEVKDPSDPSAPPPKRATFAKDLQSGGFINDRLVPKARDSYTYLHLMARDTKPFVFVVVLGMDQVSFDRTLLGPFSNRLLGRIRREASKPWQRKYVSAVVVVTESDWAKHFPMYPLRRAGQLAVDV